MPQLEIEHYLPQLFWFAVSFGTLFLCLTWLILPKVERNIRARESKIRSSIDSAEQVKTSLEQLRLKYESAMEDGRQSARLMLEEETARINSSWNEKNKSLLEEIRSLIQNEKVKLGEEEATLVIASKDIGKEIAQKLEKRFRG